ncbi:unnamed protein product [Lupinus luteus]|uniref:Protein phosphatase 1 regulatory subunit pprA n=1 Tax=Lupinus luteus TaxID=3873 RepID=A0AAV1W3Q1_LUPLU
MFRFSSFQAQLQNNKQKKTVQSSSEVIAKAMQDDLRTQVYNDLSYMNRSSNPHPLKGQVHRQMNINGNHISDRDSVEHICRSADLDSKFSFESQVEVQQTRLLKKSHSVASGLHLKESLYTNRITEYDADSTFSFNGSKSHNDSPVSGCGQDHDIIPIDHCKKNQNPEFQVSSALANEDLIFSVGDLTASNKDALEISDTPLSAEFASDSAEQTSGPSTPSLVKSHSLSDFIDHALSSGAYAFNHPPSISRSSNDLHALCKRQKDVLINESDHQIKGDQERENDIGNIKESHMDNFLNAGVDSYMISGSPKDWVMPTIDEIGDIETLRRDSSSGCFGEYPNKDFKVKRIEDWVVGLQHCGPPLEIINELPEFVGPIIDVNTKNGVTAVEVDHKVTLGTKAGEKYISYMSVDATTANLTNLGLVVIPSLSAFVSLKVINLSGNAIARITTGSLPRGLHVLNLSKNNISTIEGLRELTRLRAIDLSFNRIVRIGHGLASCSSLKELYLAGNKISEVEGLHRLLKLSILDLRFNKFSTAKCLGQLAANYNSLQAINLEGNPAQKNVGDEQLKKYLQGLLPHLVYYNRQPTKARTWKDEADRSVLLGKISYQFDRSRSLRADRNTTTRKSSRPSNSSTVGRNQRAESQKLAKGKQIQPPPSSGTSGSTQSRNHFDDMSLVLNSTAKLSISSEGYQGSSHNDSPVSGCGQDNDIIPTDHCKKNQNPEFQVSSALANDDLIFSVGDLTASNKDALEIYDTPLSAEFASDSAEQTSGPSTPSLVKSHSLSDFIDHALSSGAYAFNHPPSISRSSNDLHALCKRQKDVLINESDHQIKGDQERENDIGNIKESHMDNFLNAGVDSYLISGSPKDWVMPTIDEMRDIETLRRDSSSGCFGEYPNKDFKDKRIKDWVVDLQHCGSPLEIVNELPESVDPVIDVNTKNGVTAVEVDHKVTPGMGDAEKYISYLSDDATTANLANHGLVVIPSLSAFVSLKVLNLSRNAIVKITALPRGLHVLNLSKNNICTIEGLRELTRLRAIDLSFNRIVRIGHGLASCSSLKELYLAGNKISEVDGLHRLLKLSILDLRFNKISTTKCLGQLAANYNSLQAISLEGNPAQKNVGDEQLKKYLQGLLPRLVYYNRQPTKASTWKDEADRSILLGNSSYYFDRSRSLRSDRKTTTMKGSRPSNSSTAGKN